MAICQSMQRVRFSSPDGYEKFKVVFADARRHLKTLPGFLHLTWWIHPDKPGWHNEVSLWTSFEARARGAGRALLQVPLPPPRDARDREQQRGVQEPDLMRTPPCRLGVGRR
jgi:hypothetical protein